MKIDYETGQAGYSIADIARATGYSPPRLRYLWSVNGQLPAPTLKIGKRFHYTEKEYNQIVATLLAEQPTMKILFLSRV